MGQTHYCYKTSKFRNSCSLAVLQITDNENVIVNGEVVFNYQFVTFILIISKIFNKNKSICDYSIKLYLVWLKI